MESPSISHLFLVCCHVLLYLVPEMSLAFLQWHEQISEFWMSTALTYVVCLSKGK